MNAASKLSEQQGLLGRRDADRDRRGRRSSLRAITRSAARCAWAPAISPLILGGLLIAVRPLHPGDGAAQQRKDRGLLVAASIDRAADLALSCSALLIDRAGFVPAMLVLIFGSATASTRIQIPRGAAVLGVPDRARGGGVHLGARPALSAVRGFSVTLMDLFDNLIFGFEVAFSLQNLLYCLIGVTVGTLIGVLPGIGPLGTIAMLMPITYSVVAGERADHAGRHLLRRPVRRLDHRHPGQPAGRDLRGGDLHRRLPDGAAGARRAGARDRRHRLVFRRHGRHAADRASPGRRSPRSRSSSARRNISR